MDATCKIQGSIHVFRLVHKYVSRILGTYQNSLTIFICKVITLTQYDRHIADASSR